MSLTATFVADFSSFMDATREAVTAMQGFKQSAEELGPGVDRGLDETLKIYEQLGRQTRQLALDAVQAGKTFVGAYTESQDAVQRVTSALEAQGNATPALVQQYRDLAAEFQNTTKYSASAVTSVEAVLTSIGKVGPEQMQLALTATTNLASAMKIDLSTAADMVAKAIGSGGENLGRLKTAMGDSIEPGMATADMLQAINEKFGGAAQNDLKTWNGQVEQMHNQLGDFNEQVGKVIVDNLQTLLGIFRSMPEGVQTFVLAVVAIGTAVAPVLVSISSLVSLLSTTGLAAGMIESFTALLAWLGPAGWIALAVIGLATLIYKYWDSIVAATERMYNGVKTWLVDKFTDLVNLIKAPVDGIIGVFNGLYNTVVGHSIVPDLIDGIGEHFGRLNTEMVAPVQAAAGAVRNEFLDIMRYQNQVNAILKQNSLFTSASQWQDIARIPVPGDSGGAGGGAPVTVNNTFNIVDTESNLARRVSELIMQSIRSGTQLTA